MEPWAAVALVVGVVGLCLWGLFHRGSMSDRARTDPGDPGAPPVDGGAPAAAEPVGMADGADPGGDDGRSGADDGRAPGDP